LSFVHKSRRLREPVAARSANFAVSPSRSVTLFFSLNNSPPRTSPAGAGHLGFAPRLSVRSGRHAPGGLHFRGQRISGPSRSRVGLAPTCSTRWRFPDPRK